MKEHHLVTTTPTSAHDLGDVVAGEWIVQSNISFLLPE